VTVDRRSGALCDVRSGDRRLLDGGFDVAVWRAPTDNDGLKVLPVPTDRPLARWRAAGLDRVEHRCLSMAVAARAGRLVTEHVHTPANAPPITERRAVTVTPAGIGIESEVEVPPELADLPRLGHTFLVPAPFDTVRWLGLGPGENYPDRCAGALYGWHEGPIDELPYLMPQEFGLRGGVRRWELDDSAGHGLAIVANRPTTLAMSATHHTARDLTEATDELSLRRSDSVVVHVDVAHRGLGTMSCGPDTAPRYRLRAGRWRWRWWLEPIGV
jgi:beta-galactosidase